LFKVLEVLNCWGFCKKNAEHIDTKKSGKMADVWQMGEICWDQQNLLYRRFFIRRLKWQVVWFQSSVFVS